MAAFRLDPDIIDKIKKLADSDKVNFRSQAEIIDSALHHFLSLNKSQQKEILKEYLTKNL